MKPHEEASIMGIGISIFLFAAGAILAFAVEASAEGVDLDTVGVILMLVGGLGLLLSMLVFGDSSPWRRREDIQTERTVYRDREPV
ncbi:MAG: DUF6458 family protein [Acidimicrobiia bacterium]